MGEVFRRTRDGKFIGYSLRWYEGGKRRVMASRQSSHAEARRMLQAIEGRIARGLVGLEERPAQGQELTLLELAERFLVEYQRPENKDPVRYREHAQKSLRRAFPSLGRRAAASIKSGDITKLRDGLSAQYATGSIRATLATLQVLYTWASSLGLVATNPCKGVKRPRPSAMLEFLSKDEAARLLACCEAGSPPLFPMLATALYTGLRKGELFGLRWRDLDFSGLRLHVERSYSGLPKGNRARHLRLPSRLAPILEAWRARCPATAEGLVFPVLRGGSRRTTGRATMGREQDMLGIEALLDKAGCPHLTRPWHAMRHTYASHFVMAGGNILALQKILGHADLKMTMIYAHLAPDFLEGEMEKVSY